MLLVIALAAFVASMTTLSVLSRALQSLDVELPARAALPPMTVIRPVRGLDPGLEDNVRAALRLRYPAELETLFVLDDESDPSFPVIARVIEDQGASARVLFSGAPPLGRTGKLHAMIRGLAVARARTALVCFADSDTRPRPHLLERLAHTVVTSPDVGAAFARVISTHAPRTAGDVGYALMLDGLYGPQVVLASRSRGTVPFVMGQTMVLRRAALDAVGGLEGSEGELVDDMHIGARLAAAGYRNVLSSPVAIVQEGLTFAELRSIAGRWLLFGRTGIPFWPFDVPTATWLALYFVGIAGGLLSLAHGDVAALSVFGATTVSVVMSLELLRRQQGGAALPVALWWAPFVCLALLPAWYLRARFAKDVVWRGRSYALDPAGRLGDQVAPVLPRVPQMP